MPNMMINVNKSKYNFEETITIIEQSVSESNGWKIPISHDLQKSLVSAGHEDMTKLKVIELCHPDYAYDVLKIDGDKKISAIMPCRINVFEDKLGDVYVAEMNTSLISKMFGGNVASVMSIVSNEEKEMLNELFE